MKVLTMTWPQTPVIARSKMDMIEHVTKGGEIKRTTRKLVEQTTSMNDPKRQNTERFPKIQKRREVNEALRRKKSRMIWEKNIPERMGTHGTMRVTWSGVGMYLMMRDI